LYSPHLPVESLQLEPDGVGAVGVVTADPFSQHVLAQFGSMYFVLDLHNPFFAKLAHCVFLSFLPAHDPELAGALVGAFVG